MKKSSKVLNIIMGGICHFGNCVAHFSTLFFRKCTDSIRNEYTDICVLVHSIGGSICYYWY